MEPSSRLLKVCRRRRRRRRLYKLSALQQESAFRELAEGETAGIGFSAQYVTNSTYQSPVKPFDRPSDR